MGIIVSILTTTLEVSAYLIPLILGAYFLLFRRAETYNDAYIYSPFKSMNFSLKGYKLFFRGLGLLLILIGLLVLWIFYGGAAPAPSGRDFWNDVNEKSKQNNDLLFEFSMLGAALIAIPARMKSERFPGKPLAKLGGKSVLERVYENCMKSEKAAGVVILSDSEEIEDAAAAMGARHIMTPSSCNSGTERIIAAREELGADFVVNVQGDEPFISPKLIDGIISKWEGGARLVTAARKITDAGALADENIVKVLRGAGGSVIYFSRAPLPHVRGERDFSKWLARADYWQHIGLYGYSCATLAEYSRLPSGALEDCEKLEQLRFVAAGMAFELVETDYVSIGIDTPADLQKAEEYLKTIS